MSLFFFQLKITILTTVKYCSILHGHVCVMMVKIKMCERLKNVGMFHTIAIYGALVSLKHVVCLNWLKFSLKVSCVFTIKQTSLIDCCFSKRTR